MPDAGAQFNIHDAKTNLSRIIDRVEHGEETTTSRAGTPVAEVIPLHPRPARVGRGSLTGRLTMASPYARMAPSANMLDGLARMGFAVSLAWR